MRIVALHQTALMEELTPAFRHLLNTVRSTLRAGKH